MKWLVTGFEPFAGAQSNSSQILVKKLRARDWGGRVLFHDSVPVTFAGAWADVQKHLSSDLRGVLCLGQAESRARICLERVALNWIDARLPDNDGSQPAERPVQVGSEVLWSNIPWANFKMPAIVERSYSAGTFVCNTLMYQVMDWAAPERKLGGFVHIPVLQSQEDLQFKNSPRLEDADAEDALVQILQFLVKL
jgi:pyroglutamyl-peptidase